MNNPFAYEFKTRVRLPNGEEVGFEYSVSAIDPRFQPITVCSDPKTAVKTGGVSPEESHRKRQIRRDLINRIGREMANTLVQIVESQGFDATSPIEERKDGDYE